MRTVALSTIADVSAGQGAPKQNEFSDRGIPFVRAGSLEDLLSGKNETDLELVPAETAKKLKLKLYPRGSVLFAKSGMSATKDRIYVLQNPAHVVSHLAILTPKDNVNTEYLRLALKQFPPSILIKDRAYPAISLGEIQDYKIPVPEGLDDQKRIAYLLGKVEGLIARRRQHLQQLDDLLKSVFLEMFGDPVQNKKEWERKTAIDYSSCIVPGRDKPKSFSGNIPWVTTNDLINLGFTHTSQQDIGLNNKEIEEVRARIIPAGSVLLTCVGDLGVSSICAQNMVVNQQLHSFQVSEKMNNIFFMFALSFQKSFMYRNSSKTTVPYMNKTICNRIPMIAPPTALQNQFAAIVEKVEDLKSHYQQSLTDLETLYGTLSQKAFKDELDLSRVPLPTEGPDIAEEVKFEAEEKQPKEPLLELPEPEELAVLLKSAEGRKALLGQWLNSWLEQLGNAPFEAQPFMESARQWLWKLTEGESPDWGVAEYDELKTWVFEALEKGCLTQTYDAANNRVQIKAQRDNAG